MSDLKIDIKSVIDEFRAFEFDDDKNGKRHMNKLILDYDEAIKKQVSSSDDNTISAEESQKVMSTVKSELEALLVAIKEDEIKESIILPEAFNFRYGHWYSLYYIVGRHWISQSNAEGASDIVPEWYQNVSKILSRPSASGFRCCKQVVCDALVEIYRSSLLL